MTVFDLHVHTTKGSSDSSLTPKQLLDRALALDLDGVCLTEHGGGWDHREIDRVFSTSELTVLAGLEVETDMGHVLVYGMRSYVNGMSTVRELRKTVDRSGAVMVSAHPFRNLFDQKPNTHNLIFRDSSKDPITARQAAGHPLFEIVDDVEVFNGGNTEEENRFAADLARDLGMKGTGGSDAHSTHGLGGCLTVLDGDVRTEGDLIEILKAKAFTPVQRLGNGDPTLFS